MNYTEEQLKQALAKILPNRLGIKKDILVWSSCGQFEHEVLDTELLHLCWFIEKTLTDSEVASYSDALEYAETRWWSPFNASWQQRVVALAKVKAIEL